DEVHPAAGSAAHWSITNLSPVATAGLVAALELVEGVGMAAIEARIAQRVAGFEQMLLDLGCEIVSATESRAGILAFAVPGVPSGVVGAALAAGGITATVRADHVRLSPHASTAPETVELVRATLTRAAWT